MQIWHAGELWQGAGSEMRHARFASCGCMNGEEHAYCTGQDWQVPDEGPCHLAHWQYPVGVASGVRL